ncbi:MAG: MCE family protein [Thermoleophilaceae bacterium]|nr:MCE family protein [Thermoleophilaceae bacterium]
MRRLLTALVLLVVVVVAVGISTGASEEDGAGYEVRAIFDNVAAAVEGEDVKIAGAKVGQIKSLDVTPENKAAVVLQIDSKGFAPFRENAKCTIRPQGLIGEKFVECDPGSAPSPELAEVEEGKPGAGQALLPIERNSTPVDLDLINDTLRLPYGQRLSIIINEFGTGLAGRTKELREAINRANPALRETDKVLKILADENQVLADLARDSDAALAPLAREKGRVQGFIDNANTVSTATAERSADLQRTFQKFPSALRALRPTLRDLGALSDEMTPVLRDLGESAPDLNRFLLSLGPFSEEAIPSLDTLGDALEVGLPALKASDPLLKDVRAFARDLVPLASDLDSLTASLDETGGIERIMDYLFFQVTAINGFDGVSHYLRAQLIANTCTTYAIDKTSGCNSNFTSTAVTSAKGSSKKISPHLARQRKFLDSSDYDKASKGKGTGKPLPSAGLQQRLLGIEDPKIKKQREANIRAQRKQANNRGGTGSSEEAAVDFLLGNDK